MPRSIPQGPVHRPLALAVALACAASLLSGCLATSPTLGGGGTVASGSAGGSEAQGAAPQLEKCDEPLGTVALVEEQNEPWYAMLRGQQLGSTIPVLRLMVQQSNCFMVVERGKAFQNMQQERALMQSGEMREGSNMGKGQMVAADYTLSPSVTISAKGTSGGGLGLGGFGLLGAAAGFAAGSFKANEASTMLLMIDNRSGIQLTAAEGSAKNYDFGLVGGLFGGGLGAVGGGYANTPQGKVIVAAFLDSYNKTVKAVRNYKAQQVRGGAGTGGRLGVQGGSTPASKEVGAGKAK